SPRIAAISSIRLLVVSGSPPDSSFSLSPIRIRTAQPPGPGFPRHAPSVNISTRGVSVTSGYKLAWKLEDHPFRTVIGNFFGHGDRFGKRIEALRDQDSGSGGPGGETTSQRLSEPVPIDVGGPFDQAGGNPHPLSDLRESKRIAAVRGADDEHSATLRSD